MMTYRNLAADRQHRPQTTRHHRLANRAAKLQPPRKISTYAAGGWVCLYNTAGNIHHGAKKDLDDSFAQNQNCSHQDRPVQDPRFWPVIKSRLAGCSPARRQVALPGPAIGHAERRRQARRLCRLLQAVFQPARQCRLASVSAGWPDSVCARQVHGQVSAESRRLRRPFRVLSSWKVKHITGYRPARGRGGLLAIMFGTPLTGLQRPSIVETRRGFAAFPPSYSAVPSYILLYYGLAPLNKTHRRQLR